MVFLVKEKEAIKDSLIARTITGSVSLLYNSHEDNRGDRHAPTTYLMGKQSYIKKVMHTNNIIAS